MRTTISCSEKRNFLKWFLTEFNMKHHESLYLLQYISKKESLLDIIHFVDDVTLCPRSIIVSTDDMNEHSFLYRKNHVYTSEPEKAFHDIRLDREETIYCQLNFMNRNSRVEYAAVLEENPFYQPDLSNEFGDEAQDILDRLTYTYKRARLYQEINKALDEGNQHQFNMLTDTLNEL